MLQIRVCRNAKTPLCFRVKRLRIVGSVWFWGLGGADFFALPDSLNLKPTLTLYPSGRPLIPTIGDHFGFTV